MPACAAITSALASLSPVSITVSVTPSTARRCSNDGTWCLSRSANSIAPARRPSTLTKAVRSEEHTSELQSHSDLVCRLLLEKKKKKTTTEAKHTPTQWRHTT